MKESRSSKLLLGIGLGAVAGVAAVLLAQSLSGRGELAEGGASTIDSSREVEVVQAQLDDALGKAARLERENKRITAELVAALEGKQTVADSDAEAGDETEKKEGVGETVLKAMMEFGAVEERKKVDIAVADLAVRLNLTEPQQEEVRAALLDKLKKQQEAGLLMMSGKASINDLAAADEDNFREVDAAMKEILSDSQLAEYTAYAEEREVKRVERKANEDLEGLQGVADLTEEQADQAWGLFADLNAAEKPGEIPEGTTITMFEELIDGAINQRVEGLQPILTAEQLEAYQGQTEEFRAMITALIKGGTGS